MLPPRAYAEPLPPFSANVRAEPSPFDARPALVVAVDPADVDRFPAGHYVRMAARTTNDAVRLIERWRPRVVAIDWDLPAIDPVAICSAAKQVASTAVLTVMQTPDRAPRAIKAGSHAVLLKPLIVNLVAARLGRLCREMPAAVATNRLGRLQQWGGTNRTWPELNCPQCNQANAVGFEYSSHRRSWYGCLACEHVWLGVRRE